MEELNLYTLDIGKRYEFIATVGERVTDEIRAEHSGFRTPDYWNKERIILNDVKIFNGSEYVEFEPKIKMELGKQFKTTSEYDIIEFNAAVGVIDPYYGDYDNDDRGGFLLKVYGMCCSNYTGTKNELEKFIKDYNIDSNNYTLVCNEVRRLIRPTKLEIILKAPSEDIA